MMIGDSGSEDGTRNDDDDDDNDNDEDRVNRKQHTIEEDGK